MKIHAKPVILVAEDEATNIRILLETLKDDYELIIAKNGQEAIQRINIEDPPDMILLDIDMPVMNGHDACRQIKQNPRLKYIPVIFITAKSEEADEARGFELGAVDYITKPFSPSLVRMRIHTQLELKKHRDDLESLAEARAQQLVHADRLVTLGTLTAGIVHEINNPLSFITLSSAMMKSQVDKLVTVMAAAALTPDQRKTFDAYCTETLSMTANLQEGSERIEQIIQSMKSFYRKDQGEKVPVPIDGCVEDALRISHNTLKYHVKVEKSIPANLPTLTGVPQRLVQVLVNLFNNAAHAMEGRKDSRLAITAQRMADPDGVRLLVEDNGPGLPPDKLETIWDAFYTTKGPEKGTGLGLSISRGIITEHHGKIWAENRPEGGARFVIEVPLALARTEPTPALQSNP